FYRRARSVGKTAANRQSSHSFGLSSALKFALLLSAVLLISKAATTYLGTASKRASIGQFTQARTNRY
ncbi:MAG TPA: hypothetical protein DFS52_02290, partial [Myxococcales bacterium]|nr:hypothetical protein [Myxococcales bacterium]